MRRRERQGEGRLLRARAPGHSAVAAGLAAAAILAAALAGAQEHLGDIVMDRHSSARGQPPVVFPHWQHRILFRCYACHPSPFEMRAGAHDITMDAIRSGDYCGRCHNGRVAFEVAFETCRECHSYEPP